MPGPTIEDLAADLNTAAGSGPQLQASITKGAEIQGGTGIDWLAPGPALQSVFARLGRPLPAQLPGQGSEAVSDRAARRAADEGQALVMGRRI